MDRRRFVPSPEGLEGRTLLTTFGGRSSTSPIPAATLQQRTFRIDRLPNYLLSLQPGRVVHAEVVERIQGDLTALVGTLHDPPPAALRAFNNQLRTTLAHASLRPDDARGLGATFAKVLEAAGGSPRTIAQLQQDMEALARVDAVSRDPAALAANDYALVLQVALAVGRPIRMPPAPRLFSGDDTGAKGDRSTAVVQPHLVGSYDPGTTIQIVDANDPARVLGSAAVPAGGRYSVAFARPLPAGRTAVRVRAVDAGNNVSRPSAPLTLTIVAAPHPRGPLSFR